jgi:hypothetical protein
VQDHASSPMPTAQLGIAVSGETENMQIVTQITPHEHFLAREVPGLVSFSPSRANVASLVGAIQSEPSSPGLRAASQGSDACITPRGSTATQDATSLRAASSSSQNGGFFTPQRSIAANLRSPFSQGPQPLPQSLQPSSPPTPLSSQHSAAHSSQVQHSESEDSEMMSADMEVEVLETSQSVPETQFSLQQGHQQKSIRVQFLTTKQVRKLLLSSIACISFVHL